MNIGGGRKIFGGGGGELAPGDTCSPCHCGARRGGEPPAALARPAAVVPGGAASPRRHWLSLPLRCRRGDEPTAALAVPAFCFLSCPLSPQPPSPAGKGETFSLFRRGLPPPAPRALNRLRHLQSLPSRCPAADSVRHHLKETDSCRFCGKPWVQSRGCKGRSPLHKKTKNLPLPAGKGVGGMGAESKLKAAGAGGKQGKPPSGHRQHRNGKKSRKGRDPPLPPADKLTVDSQLLTANCQLPTANNQYL